MSNFCPKCDNKLPDNSMFCSYCGSYADSPEKHPIYEQSIFEQQPHQNPKKHIKSILIISLIVIFLITIFVLINSALKRHSEKEAFIAQAQSDLLEINECYEYYGTDSLMQKLDEYEENYSDSDTYNSKYYKFLPDELRAEKVCYDFKVKVVSSYYNNVLAIRTRCPNPLEKNITIDEFDIRCLSEYLSVIINYFPDGYDYIDSNNTVSHFEITDDIMEYYYDVLLVENVLLYNNGEKTEAIENIQNLLDNKELRNDSKTFAKNTLITMKANNPATSFEIVSGSNNVDIFTAKNYRVTCPYCGYQSGAMGTMDEDFSPSKHYSGETVTVQRAMICASPFRGGCSEISNYQLRVEFK